MRETEDGTEYKIGYVDFGGDFRNPDGNNLEGNCACLELSREI